MSYLPFSVTFEEEFDQYTDKYWAAFDDNMSLIKVMSEEGPFAWIKRFDYIFQGYQEKHNDQPATEPGDADYHHYVAAHLEEHFRRTDTYIPLVQTIWSGISSDIMRPITRGTGDLTYKANISTVNTRALDDEYLAIFAEMINPAMFEVTKDDNDYPAGSSSSNSRGGLQREIRNKARYTDLVPSARR